jgi:hypothetical protein
LDHEPWTTLFLLPLCLEKAHLCRSLSRLGDKKLQKGALPMIKLTWLPNWHAYAVRLDGRIVGMVRCTVPLPFRPAAAFA